MVRGEDVKDNMTRRETGEKNKVVEESQKSNRGDYGSKYVESGEKREKK